MGGGVLVAKTGHDRRGRKGQSSDNGRDPFDGDKINRLSIGDGSLDTSDRFPVRIVDEDLHLGVDVGEIVGNARNLGLCARIDGNVEWVVEISGTHGTEAFEAIASSARIDGLAYDYVAIGGYLKIEDDIALNGGGGGHVDSEGIVVGRVDHIKQAGGEAGIGLTGTERGRVQERVCGGDGSGQLRDAEQEERERPVCACEPHRECIVGRSAAEGDPMRVMFKIKAFIAICSANFVDRQYGMMGPETNAAVHDGLMGAERDEAERDEGREKHEDGSEASDRCRVDLFGWSATRSELLFQWLALVGSWVAGM